MPEGFPLKGSLSHPRRNDQPRLKEDRIVVRAGLRMSAGSGECRGLSEAVTSAPSFRHKFVDCLLFLGHEVTADVILERTVAALLPLVSGKGV